MKKTLWLSLAILLVCIFTLSACDGGNQPQSPNDTNNSTPSDTTDTTEDNSHVHSFDEWIQNKRPTCTDDGTNERYCFCGERQTQTIGALGHDGVIDAAVAATCTTDGKTEGKHCSRCNETLIPQTTVGNLGHIEVIDAAVAATCTTDGKAEGKHCSRCNETLVAQTVVGKLGHVEVIDAAVAATCTTDGKTEGKHCSRCTLTLVAQTTIGKLGHIEVIDTAVAATCTTAGKAEGKHCSRCNATLVAQTVVGKLGHVEVIDAAVAATCTTDGKTEGKHCSRCTLTLVAQTTIGKLGHIEVIDTAVAATCTTDGKTEGKHCSRCNETLIPQTTVGNLGHIEVIDTAVAATCTTDGKTEGKHCSRCNATLVVQHPTQATWHKFEAHRCVLCKKSCEELCINYYDMSSESNGTIIGYIFDSPDEIGFYHMYVIGEGKMKDYSASKSPIKLDGYGSKITRLIISEGITSIGDYTFEFCDYITTVDIPNTVTSIGHQAFYECDSLSYITLSENIKHIGDNAFSATAHYKNADNWYRNMYYVDDVLVDAKSTISGNHTLKAGTKTIVERAFYNCSELTGITIPNTVVAINQWAFYGCTKLSTITFEGNSKCKEIGYWAFYGTKIKSIVIPKSVTYIENYAFDDCRLLENIEVEQGNLSYTSIDGVLFDKKATTLLLYPTANSRTEYIVPSTVKKIERSAFEYSTYLTKVTISTNVEEIGMSAFYGCSKLTTVIFETPNGWTMHRYYSDETIQMTESSMKNVVRYLTHVEYSQYTWIRQ